MADQGRYDFCVVFTIRLCAFELKNVNKLVISNYTALKLGVQALRGYLKLNCKFELHTLSNTQASAAKDHAENNLKIRSLLVRHLFRSCLLYLI